MDFFERRQYWLNRKLLILIGQWPYQKPTTKIQRNLIIFVMILSMTVVQMAKFVTSEISLDLCCNIFSTQMVLIACVIKYMTYSINSGKVKILLDKIKNDWSSLTDCIENNIAQDIAEEGRLYNLGFTPTSLVIFAGVAPQILDIIAPINGTHPKRQIITAEYFVDGEKYFFPILMHTAVSSAILLTILIATDSFYVTCIYHACAMFNVVSYRLEHLFDKYIDANKSENERETQTHSRIVNAVEGHKNATEYADYVNTTYGTSYFIAMMISLANTSVNMYCMVVSWQHGSASVTNLVISLSQIIHVMIVDFPPQKMMDSSALITFKAYSSTWYMASSKMQALLIPIMVRGMKPSIVVVGKLISLTIESACTIIQTSLSYCTVLLSFA